MGHPRKTDDGCGLSPWTMLSIIGRRAAGENVAELNTGFGVSRSTISRWMRKWGHEAKMVNELVGHRQEQVRQNHQDVMAIADASHRLHTQVLAIHSLLGTAPAALDKLDSLVSAAQAIEDSVRAFEKRILVQFANAADFAKSATPG